MDSPPPTIPTTMRAITHSSYGAPRDVLSIADISTPPVPADHVLVRVSAAAVHKGDWHLVTGTPFFIRILFGGISKPKHLIPGAELSGTVVALGPDLQSPNPLPTSESGNENDTKNPPLAIGDTVVADLSNASFGAFAQYVAAPAELFVRAAPSATPQQAAAANVSALAALQALRDCAGMKKGDAVLVTGASGGVGSFALQMAAAMGASVVHGVCSRAKMDVLKKRLGAREGSVPLRFFASEDFDVRSGDGETKYDVVVDAAAYQSPGKLFCVMKKGATLVVVGGATGVFMRTMAGAPWMSLRSGRKVRCLDSKPSRADLEKIQRMVEAGDVTPVVDRSFPLDQTGEAIGYIEDRKVVGKVVIEVEH